MVENKEFRLHIKRLKLEKDLTQAEIAEKLGVKSTYLIPMSAMAGSLTGFDTEGVCPRECERIVSPIAGVDFAISVYGDSMVPEFPSGSRVLLKRINHTIYIEWGNVFVLDTTNGIILKEVQPSAKEGILTCHSLNPNGRYKDFDVPMCEIRAMYKVLACVIEKIFYKLKIMGLYYRKRIKILPGVHMNLSKSGTSLSVGRRGASVNFGKKGTYMNVGIPGTGIHSLPYQET